MAVHPELADTRAVILAGGLGTRLRSVVADRPKVLAPVLQRPFVTFLLDQLAAAGLRQVIFLTGFRGEQVEQELGASHGGMTLLYSREHAPLGTAGALRAALPLLPTSNILLLNGDSYCHVDLIAFAAFHTRQRADASLVVTLVPNSGRYGQVVLAADHRVTCFTEKTQPVVRGPSVWINAGIYLLRRSVVEVVPTGRAVSLEREVLPNIIVGGKMRRIIGYRCPGPFLDIGTPDSYKEAETFFSATHREVGCASLQT